MLKGTTIIELTDVNSGEVKTIKEQNFITNALKDLCQPILRNQDTLVSTMFKQEEAINTEALLRGILLFGSTLGENANDYFPSVGASMVGHGGDSTYAGSDLSMGSFNASQSDLASPDERTYVWDFTAEQANGIINSVCLTTQVGGQIGYGTATKPEKTNAALRPFSNITKSKIRAYSQNSIAPLARIPVFLSFINDYLLTFNMSRFAAGELVFNKINFDSRKIDIFKQFPSMSSIEGWQRASNFAGEPYTSREEIVITYPSNFAKTGGVIGMAQDGKYLYLVEPTNLQESVVGNVWAPNSVIKILKIDLQTLGHEVLSVTNTTGKALSMRVGSQFFTSGCNTFGVSNGYLFARSWVQSGGEEVAELFAINLSNNTDVKQVVDRNGKTNIVGVESPTSAMPFIMSIQGKVCFITSQNRPNYNNSSNNYDVMAVVSTDDFIMKYYDTPMSSVFAFGAYSSSGSQYSKLIPTDNKLYFAVEERSGEGSTTETTFYVHVYPNVLMTINNLQSPIEKTPAQTMRVTYKIMKV